MREPELVGRAEAMRRMGLSPTAFQRRVRDGVITNTLVDGRKMYDVAELEASRLESDEANETKYLTNLLMLTRDILKDSRTHNLELMKLVKEPAEVFVKGMKDEIASLRTAAEEQKRTWLEARKLVEELTTEKHERELEKTRTDAGEKRKDEAFEMLKGLAPSLLEQVFGVKLVGDFLRGLSPEQLALLTDEGPLTDVQRATLKEILAKFETKKAEPKPEVTSNGKH